MSSTSCSPPSRRRSRRSGAGGALEFSGEPLFYEELGIAAAEGETDWVKLLDYAVATMHEDGSLSELSRTWYDGLDLTVAK